MRVRGRGCVWAKGVPPLSVRRPAPLAYSLCPVMCCSLVLSIRPTGRGEGNWAEFWLTTQRLPPQPLERPLRNRCRSAHGGWGVCSSVLDPNPRGVGGGVGRGGGGGPGLIAVHLTFIGLKIAKIVRWEELSPKIKKARNTY